MAQIHSQIAANVKLPNGQTAQVQGPAGLVEIGPLFPIRLSLGDQFASELAKRNEPIPAPVTGVALLDTGAKASAIDEGIAKQLHLPVTDVADLMSASHALTKANVYPVKMEILAPNTQPVIVNVARAIGAPLVNERTKHLNMIALVGRDILAHCLLVYNGPAGSVTWCIQ